MGGEPHVTWYRVDLSVLGGPLDYAVYRPDAASRVGVDVWYLLHGSGGSARDWVEKAIPLLDRAINQGNIPPIIAVIPSAPDVPGASWWTDSAHIHGLPMQRAITQELIPVAETALGLLVQRSRRCIAGYSRGGAGALRMALSNRSLFSRVAALSPAVYVPQPPLSSSARTTPAFGVGNTMFDPQRYTDLNYTTLMGQGEEPLELYVAAGGDNEWSHTEVNDWEHDLDIEAARLHCYARRAPGMTSHLRVFPGGHSWKVWAPALVDGMRILSQSALEHSAT